EATLVESVLEDTTAEHDGISYTDVSASASVGADGTLFVTLSNANPKETYSLTAAIDESFGTYEARILTGEMGAYNTFDNPDRVLDQAYDGVKLSGSTAEIVLPPVSVVTVAFKK
ncbi:MAG: hypothetical protein J6S78_03665, partial [Lachnospiraceae bacterium]|nr:hypothetical protein [Lachnospiraceae bacterium]